MESWTKTLVTEDQLRAIARAHLHEHGALRGVRELTDGWFNTAYALELADGQRFVMKLAPADTVRVMRYERDIMRSEVEVMRTVRASTTVPVPRIVAYDTSRTLVDADFFCMEFLPGQPLAQLRATLPAAMSTHIDEQIGGLLRQMNALQHTAFGYYATPHSRCWRDAFALMLDDVLADGRDRDVTLPVADLRALFADLLPVMDGVPTPCLVHWDLWDGNIFADAASGQITGIIDFERALWGDPLIEATFVNLDAESAVIRGYGQPLLATPEQRCRRMLYNIYLALIMVVECAFRGYTRDREAEARATLTQYMNMDFPLVCS